MTVPALGTGAQGAFGLAIPGTFGAFPSAYPYVQQAQQYGQVQHPLQWLLHVVPQQLNQIAQLVPQQIQQIHYLQQQILQLQQSVQAVPLQLFHLQHLIQSLPQQFLQLQPTQHLMQSSQPYATSFAPGLSGNPLFNAGVASQGLGYVTQPSPVM